MANSAAPMIQKHQKKKIKKIMKQGVPWCVRPSRSGTGLCLTLRAALALDQEVLRCLWDFNTFFFLSSENGIYLNSGTSDKITRGIGWTCGTKQRCPDVARRRRRDKEGGERQRTRKEMKERKKRERGRGGRRREGGGDVRKGRKKQERRSWKTRKRR